MKKTIKQSSIAAVMLLMVFTMTALSLTGCSKPGGGKSLNSAEALKAYLDNRPANSPDTPIKAAMNVTNLLFKNVGKAIKSAGKYVYLDLSGSAITEIPDYAFNTGGPDYTGCATLVGVTIPNGVTRIGDGAFGSCISLTSVTIPDSVTSIGVTAFVNCTSLTGITIPDSVTRIGDSAFINCYNLTDVTIPNNVTGIGEYAFSKCTSLANVTIGNSVTSIGREAFYYCTSLASVTIPAGVTSIGEFAFSRCTGLTSVTFQGTIPSSGFSTSTPFPGDLRTKYLAGGIGTYTRPNGPTWTKQQ